jgi:hypothetical protein
MRYLARFPLRDYLATLPASIESLDYTADEGSVLLRLEGSARTLNIGRLKQPLHVVFANWSATPKEVIAFTKKFGSLWNPPEYEDGDEDQTERSSEHLLLASDWLRSQQEFRDAWRAQLGNLPTPKLGSAAQQLQAMRENGLLSEGHPAIKSHFDSLISSVEAQPSFSMGKGGLQLEVVAADLWSYVVLRLIAEEHAMLRYCQNDKCDAPYFVAQRKDQKFCGTDCSQAVAARRWWSSFGNDWREKRKKKAKGRRQK